MTNNNRDNLLGVFQTVYRWRKAIRNVCLLALVGSVGISLLLDNYYKAVTIFYPASPQLSNPELLFGNTGQVTEYFGSDHDLDRLVEIANSNELADFMVANFDLYKHYDIDSTKKEGPHKVREHLRSLYNAQKNKNDAIELSIEDTDPVLAGQMANAARNKINEVGRRLTKESQAKLLKAFEDNISRKQTELTALADSLRRLQAANGVFDPNAQSTQLTQQLTRAEADIVRYRASLELLEDNPDIPRDTIAFMKANLRAAEQLRREIFAPVPAVGASGVSETGLNLRRVSAVMPQISTLQDLHYQGRKQLSYDFERYNQIKSAYNSDIPALHMVEAAETPLIKSRPKRSIIVIVSLIAAFLFSVMGALIAESYRDVNWKEVLQ